MTPWTKFQRATLPPVTPEMIDAVAASMPNIPRDEIVAVYADLDNDAVFLNNRYQVNVRKLKTPGDDEHGRWPCDVAHLSIKRIDKDRVGPERYRDFMRIRDELVGPEFEAVEIYPPRSDEVDTANQYHLWVFLAAGMTLPFGWHGQRMVIDTVEPGSNARQHPRDPEHRE